MTLILFIALVVILLIAGLLYYNASPAERSALPGKVWAAVAAGAMAFGAWVMSLFHSGAPTP